MKLTIFLVFAFLKTLLYNEFINLKHYFYVVDFSKVSPLVALRLYHLHNIDYAKLKNACLKGVTKSHKRLLSEQF